MGITDQELRSRLSKFDSFFLWVASLSGVGFSIFVGYSEIAWAPYVPIFFLIGFALVIGYLRGGVFSESFTERIRGWHYLLLGLITYILFTSFHYLFNPHLENILQGSSLFIQTVVISVAIIFFILIFERKTTPWLYDNFDQPLCKITKRILRRTLFASIILGTLLYVFAIILSQINPDFSILIYIITALLLLAPIANEEKRIGKLLPLERYYKYVEVELIETRKWENYFLVALGTSEVLLLIVSWIPFENANALLPIVLLILLFIGSFVGYFISLYCRDRGDLVKEVDIAKSELSPEDLGQLRQLIIKANT